MVLVEHGTEELKRYPPTWNRQFDGDLWEFRVIWLDLTGYYGYISWDISNRGVWPKVRYRYTTGFPVMETHEAISNSNSIWVYFITTSLSDLESWLRLVGGLEHEFYFPRNIGNNHSNWRSYFSEGWPNHQPEGESSSDEISNKNHWALDGLLAVSTIRDWLRTPSYTGLGKTMWSVQFVMVFWYRQIFKPHFAQFCCFTPQWNLLWKLEQVEQVARTNEIHGYLCVFSPIYAPNHEKDRLNAIQSKADLPSSHHGQLGVLEGRSGGESAHHRHSGWCASGARGWQNVASNWGFYGT